MKGVLRIKRCGGDDSLRLLHNLKMASSGVPIGAQLGVGEIQC
jgi:hypothetical protein